MARVVSIRAHVPAISREYGGGKGISGSEIGVSSRGPSAKFRTLVVKHLLLPIRVAVGCRAQLFGSATPTTLTRDDRGTRHLPACERSRSSECRPASP